MKRSTCFIRCEWHTARCFSGQRATHTNRTAVGGGTFNPHRHRPHMETNIAHKQSNTPTLHPSSIHPRRINDQYTTNIASPNAPQNVRAHIGRPTQPSHRLRLTTVRGIYTRAALREHEDDNGRTQNIHAPPSALSSLSDTRSPFLLDRSFPMGLDRGSHQRSRASFLAARDHPVRAEHGCVTHMGIRAGRNGRGGVSGVFDDGFLYVYENSGSDKGKGGRCGKRDYAGGRGDMEERWHCRYV